MVRGGEKHDEEVLSPSFLALFPSLSPLFYAHFVIDGHSRIFLVSLENWVKLTLPCRPL